MKKLFNSKFLVSVALAFTLLFGFGSSALAEENPTTTEKPDNVVISQQNKEENKIPNEDKLVEEIKALISDYEYYKYDEEALKNATNIADIEKVMREVDENFYYFTKEQYEKTFTKMNGTSHIFGFKYQYSDEGGKVVEIVKNSPAEKAGVQVGDILVKVNGVDIKGFSLEQIVETLNGLSPETDYELVFSRNNVLVHKTMQKEEIDIAPMTSLLTEDGLAVFQIDSFGTTLVEELLDLLEEYDKLGMKGIFFVLDNNPGGIIDTCFRALDIFFDEQLLGYEKYKNDSYMIFGSNNNDEFDYRDIPVVISISENSASCAEIFTSAFRDYQKAVIVGQNSYGSGNLKYFFTLSDGSAVKMSGGEMHSPIGTPIASITPDIATKDFEETSKIVVGLYENYIAEQNVKLNIGSNNALVKGESKTLSDVIIEENGISYAPLNEICDILGFELVQKGNLYNVFGFNGKLTFNTYKNEMYYKESFEEISFKDGKNGLMVPIRSFLELMGYDVIWESADKSIHIEKY